MNETSKLYLFLIVVLTTAVIVAVICFKWWIGRRHTRERFAFFSVRLFAGFMITVISLLLARNQILEALIGGFNVVFGYEIPFEEPTDNFVAPIIVLFCSGLLYRIITDLHDNWNGLVSTRQMDLMETGRRVSVLKDHQFYWKRRDEIETYKRKEKSTPEVFSSYELDTRPWHIKAANLFNLLDQQYNIKEEHWYGEYQCYLSYYGQENEKMGILCLEKPPTSERINAFVNFIKTREGKFHKLIVAISGEEQRNSYSNKEPYVEFRYESEMLDSLIPLSRYKDFINDYFNQNTLENSTLNLSDMYVPLAGYGVVVGKGKFSPGKTIKSVEKYILNWAKNRQRNSTEHLTILGDYGQGKTVLMHKIAKEMLDHPKEYGRIPILIDLRGLSPRNDDEMAIFGRWANRFQAKAEALWELHRAGKLFIILDGFDEMDLVGDTELLFNHFKQLWTLARVPNSQVLIAGRPNLFADDEERRMALGIQNPRLDLPYSKAIYLDKLSADQIEQVLRGVQAGTKKGILDALKQSGGNSNFAELIGRPSTLYQLSTVWDSELAKQKDLLNSATVIGSFVQKVYDRQERKDSTVLTSSERHYFMMGIAVGMMLEHGYSNQIKNQDLKRWVEKLWNNYPAKLPPYQDAMQGSKAHDFLPVRLRENPDAFETILKDVRVGGILVQDISGRDIFKFAHKSYMEYLVSAFFSGFVLQNAHDRPLLMMVNAIAQSSGFNSGKLKTSPDVEQFSAELVAAQIEVFNAQGKPVSPTESPQLYSKRLYKMLILKSYPVRGRFCPNLTGWLSMHPLQNQFLSICFFAAIINISLTIIQKDYWYFGLKAASGFLCFWWVGIVYLYIYHEKFLKKNKLSDFLSKARLYQNTCQLLKCSIINFSFTLRLVLQNSHKQILYKEFVQLVVVISTALSGATVIAIILIFRLFDQSIHKFTVVSLFQGIGLVLIVFPLSFIYKIIKSKGKSLEGELHGFEIVFLTTFATSTFIINLHLFSNSSKIDLSIIEALGLNLMAIIAIIVAIIRGRDLILKKFKSLINNQ